MHEHDSPPDLRLWYARPAAAWVEALPLGSGRLGAMVFGGVGRERLALNVDTLWSGPPAGWDNPGARDLLPELRRLIAAGDYPAADALCRKLQGPYTQSYLPLGDLWLAFDQPGPAEDYRRALDLRAAVASVGYRAGGVMFRREVFASAPDDLLAIRLTADAPGAISLTARLESRLRHRVAPAGAERLELTGEAPRHVAPDYVPDPEPVRYGGGMTFAARLAAVVTGGSVAAGPDGLRIERADSVTLLLAAASSYGGADPRQLAAGRVEAAMARPYAELRARHIADYSALFGRVELDLGGPEAADSRPTDARISAWRAEADPGLAALLFQYGRYLLIASSRPGTQPANLQGIWSEQLRPPWSSNYTLNINTEMNYWPAEVAGLAECHRPLFDLIAGLAETGARTAATNYGCAGWVAHHNSDLWRQSAPAGGYGHGDPMWAMWPMGGAWLCRHLWEHYLFGGDEAFLRDTAYPLMRGAALFCLDWLVDDGQGGLTTAPSTSPENSFATPDGRRAAVSAGATMDLALSGDLLDSCVAASQILGLDESLRARMAAARARLPAPRVGRLGQLQEWAADWDDPADQHRHISHLYGLYPGAAIAAVPDLRAGARRSLELRGDGGTGWSMAWKLCLWARLGDGDRAARTLGGLLRPAAGDAGGVYPSLLGAHPPFQIDANFGATAGIAELLLQSHAGELHLLPALPAAWPRGQVRGLRARGCFTVDIAWAGGRLARASVRSARGGPCRVRYGATDVEIDTQPGQAYEVTL